MFLEILPPVFRPERRTHHPQCIFGDFLGRLVTGAVGVAANSHCPEQQTERCKERHSAITQASTGYLVNATEASPSPKVLEYRVRVYPKTL
jgi:hypothetical protein